MATAVLELEPVVLLNTAVLNIASGPLASTVTRQVIVTNRLADSEPVQVN